MGTTGIGRGAVALLGLLAGCASAGLAGGGGDWEVGRQWGCDPAEVEREYAAAHPEEGASLGLVPRAGWSACQLLALHGPPDRVERVEGEAGATYHLYYQAEEDTRLVTLREDVTGAWRIAAVVW